MAWEYDYCVVGAGMIGSAAAKHIQLLNPSCKVLLVGPAEPQVSQLFECLFSVRFLVYHEQQSLRLFL